MKIYLLLLGLSTLLLSSCSTSAHFKTADTDQTYGETSYENVQVYSVDDFGTDYTILGPVVACADAGTNAETPVKLLKKEASKLGADAVINLKLTVKQGYWNSGIEAKGTAVRLKK